MEGFCAGSGAAAGSAAGAAAVASARANGKAGGACAGACLEDAGPSGQGTRGLPSVSCESTCPGGGVTDFRSLGFRNVKPGICFSLACGGCNRFARARRGLSPAPGDATACKAGTSAANPPKAL